MFDSIPKSELERQLINKGLNPSSLTKISSSSCRLKIGEETYYAKVLPQHRIDGIRDLIEANNWHGLQNITLIEDASKPLLIMEEVNGQSLSILVPIYMLPLIHHSYRSHIQSLIRDFGRRLRVLHDYRTFTMSIDVNNLRFDNWDAVNQSELASPVADHLSDDVVRKVNESIKTLNDCDARGAVVHGDTALHHIYGQNSSVQIIDYDLAGYDFYWIDSVVFDCSLRLLIWRLPYVSLERHNHLMDVFFDGYGRRPDEMYHHLKIVRFATLYQYYLRSVGTNPHDSPRWKARVFKHIDKKFIKSELSSLTA